MAYKPPKPTRDQAKRAELVTKDAPQARQRMRDDGVIEVTEVTREKVHRGGIDREGHFPV